MNKKLTPAQRAHLIGKIGRAMENNPEFAKKVLQGTKKIVPPGPEKN